MSESTSILLILIVMTWFLTSPQFTAFWAVVKD